MLVLVRLNDAFLILTFLLNGVARVLFLPGIDLPRDFVIQVRSNDLDAAGCAVAARRLVVVVTRRLTRGFARFPPHGGVTLGACDHRLRRNRTICIVIREVAIDRRFTSLTIRRTGPLRFWLCQPVNLGWALFKHKTAVGNAGTRRTNSEVPRLLDAVQSRGVAARLNVTGHDHRELLRIRVLAPDADANARVRQPERRGINFVGYLLGQVEGEAALRVGRGVERRRDLALPCHVLQVDDVAFERLVVLRQVIMAAVLVDVRPAVVAVEVAPATLGKDGIRYLLVLTLALLRALVSA